MVLDFAKKKEFSWEIDLIFIDVKPIEIDGLVGFQDVSDFHFIFLLIEDLFLIYGGPNLGSLLLNSQLPMRGLDLLLDRLLLFFL